MRATRAGVRRYQIEPYVMAGDVYSHPAHRGRGGWSWYTGSAGWMYRAGVESILGLRRSGTTFAVNPCIPAAWPGYQMTWRCGTTAHHITVSNPERRGRGVREATLDGVAVNHLAIPIADDGATHEIQDRAGERVRRGIMSAAGITSRPILARPTVSGTPRGGRHTDTTPTDMIQVGTR